MEMVLCGQLREDNNWFDDSENNLQLKPLVINVARGKLDVRVMISLVHFFLPLVHTHTHTNREQALHSPHNEHA